MDFLAVRFALAAVVMIALRPACLRNLTRGGFFRAVALGIVLVGGYVMQTYGLLSASATVSGFITGMFVVFTPVVSWVLLRHRANRNTWAVVALATAGLALLGLHGWSVGIGEMLTLVCALLFAVHIVGLGAWAPHHEAYGFAFLQIVTVAVLSLAAAAPRGISVPPAAGVWVALAVTAVFATAVAFVVQTWAQSLVSPTHAAVVMTLEPVFAGIFGVAFGGDHLTPRVVLGALLILAAIFVTQVDRGPRSPRPHLPTVPG
jgi:drug/metabolite transporter (DMT)-like permease